jgi:hypothetical protein
VVAAASKCGGGGRGIGVRVWGGKKGKIIGYKGRGRVEEDLDGGLLPHRGRRRRWRGGGWLPMRREREIEREESDRIDEVRKKGCLRLSYSRGFVT